MENEVTTDDEVRDPRKVRPHLVLLGAGASRAACPNGDAVGCRLPVMADFVEVVGLGPLLERAGVDWRKSNFEELYSSLAMNNAHSLLRQALEIAVEEYFAQLTLPAEPTAYDYLLLSLRKKDVVATFNWDPLLIQAYQRSARVTTSLPYMVFLHGCVSHGFCAADEVSGLRGASCSKCGNAFGPDRLLFPVAQKNYSASPEIAFAWDRMRDGLKESVFFTIFGYGAPSSDADAVALMKSAWGDTSQRQFEQVEIVDIRSESELSDLWSPFIHTHHFDVWTGYHDSFLAKHPRRSVEAFFNQYIEAKFIADNPAPRGVDLHELHDWFAGLVEAELKAGV